MTLRIALFRNGSVAIVFFLVFNSEGSVRFPNGCTCRSFFCTLLASVPPQRGNRRNAVMKKKEVPSSSSAVRFTKCWKSQNTRLSDLYRVSIKVIVAAAGDGIMFGPNQGDGLKHS